MRLFLACAAFLPLMTLSVTARAQTGADPLIGKHLYRSYCYVCHGVDGKTAGPLAKKLQLSPADLTSGKYRSMKIDALAKLIGGYVRKKDSPMPRWGDALPEENLLNLAAYVSYLSKVDLDTRGDVRRGRAAFNAACVACHGVRGKGDGVLAGLIGIPMVDFSDSKKMSQISDESLVKTIREGRGEYMPAWAGSLSDMEIVDVAAYARSLGE